MDQQEFPRYQSPQKPIALSQNETKYKNMRLMLLMTFILSAANCLTLVLLDMFFCLSAYTPLVFIAVGSQMATEMGSMIFYIIAALFALITIVPFLLCYIFSKKHVGWMIAGLVLFSADTLFLVVDLVTAFSATLLYCLVFHVYIVVTLAMGVKYGLAVKKEKEAVTNIDGTMDPYAATETYVPQADGSFAYSTENAYTDVRRTVTVIRKKSFMGCAVPFICYAGNRQVCSLKNGKSDTFEATGESFILRAGSSNGLVVGEIQVPAGTENVTFEISMKMGMVTNTLEFRQIF
ncbi:MAG: hypothetical protein IJW00_10360 [Clostridia bacterium]|nr:hypothetical protein [Clostridia bacterium]